MAMETWRNRYQPSTAIAVGIKFPCRFLLRSFNLLVIFLFFSTNIPKTTSTSLLNNGSIFNTYNSSSTAGFASSNKSRIPCFISDVGINKGNSNALEWKQKISSLSIQRFSEVACLHDAKQPIPGIPELILNGITYSSIDFQSSLAHTSSTGFAIDKFIFELKQKVAYEKSSNSSKTDGHSSIIQPVKSRKNEGMTDVKKIQQARRDEVLLLTTYWKIYGAMNIALRVLNNQSSGKILSLSEGPGYVLNFQRARLEGKVEEIEFYLDQVRPPTVQKVLHMSFKQTFFYLTSVDHEELCELHWDRSPKVDDASKSQRSRDEAILISS
ncbi:uncharacterized protein VP01_1073g5 [Puccinia sorghi]|uniref:DUF7143 domain-containing protein n=1 Tax=Puccinia sorghi TaxID=27349 RepID=A0A0L6VTV5_9BASI|nr:uncharacterized protein VP01_1073g5 [Puccinia sorghi]